MNPNKRLLGNAYLRPLSFLVLRDTAFILFFIFSFSYYTFIGNVEGDPEGLFYWGLTLGSLLLFLICFIHVVFIAKYSIDRHSLFAIFLGVIAVAIETMIRGNSGLVKLVLIIFLIASVYRNPVRNLTLVINCAFLIAIIWSGITYHMGANIWGYLPGQSSADQSTALWWRISIFPYLTPPYSGLFSLIVLVLNYFNQSRLRNVFLILSLYFIIFSGARTVLIALFLIGVCVFLVCAKKNRSTLMFLITILVVFALFVASTVPHLLHPLVSWNEFLSSMVLRIGSEEQVGEEANTRSIMFFEFLRITVESWPFGVGRDTLSEVYRGPGGTEMAAVRIIAQSGFLGVMVLVAFFSLVYMRSLGSKIFFCVFTILLFFYSSFVAPYNFILLSLLALFSVQNSSMFDYQSTKNNLPKIKI